VSATKSWKCHMRFVLCWPNSASRSAVKGHSVTSVLVLRPAPTQQALPVMLTGSAREAWLDTDAAEALCFLR